MSKRNAQSWLDAATRAKQREPRADETEPVLSPCVGVCLMDGDTGFCRGCLRTLGEIAAWSGATNDDRRAIRASLPARRALVKHPL